MALIELGSLRGSRSAKALDDEKAIRALLAALKPLHQLRGSRSIPLPYVMAFLVVALDEGKGNNEYARILEIERRLMSRYFQDIGPKARNGGPGLGLIVAKPRRDHPRKIEISLTARGRAIADRVLGSLHDLADTPVSHFEADERSGKPAYPPPRPKVTRALPRRLALAGLKAGASRSA